LQEYITKCFKGNKLAERQFKYYQITSDENAELEMNVFRVRVSGQRNCLGRGFSI
jgi:hypothetical protein